MENTFVDNCPTEVETDEEDVDLMHDILECPTMETQIPLFEAYKAKQDKKSHAEKYFNWCKRTHFDVKDGSITEPRGQGGYYMKNGEKVAYKKGGYYWAGLWNGKSERLRMIKFKSMLIPAVALDSICYNPNKVVENRNVESLSMYEEDIPGNINYQFHPSHFERFNLKVFALLTKFLQIDKEAVGLGVDLKKKPIKNRIGRKMYKVVCKKPFKISPMVQKEQYLSVSFLKNLIK